MSRSARTVAVFAILIFATPVGAVDADSTLRDVRALVFLARRHDSLWDWVDDRIGVAQTSVKSPDDRRTITDLRYRFLLDWVRSRARVEDETRVGEMIDIYGRALGLGLSAEQSEEALTGLVDLRLGEAERIRDQGGDLGPASAHVQAVLDMDGLSSVLRDRAKNLGFLIDSHEADQLLVAGDLTRGFDRLAEVVDRYGGLELAALATARDRLETLRRTTGVLTLSLFDVAAGLAGARPEIVGETVRLPDRVRIHRRLDDYRLEDAPAADAPLSRDGPTRIRLSLTGGTHFAARFAFLGGRRPELRLPFELSRKALTVDLPDQIPARMAFVPAAGGRSGFFIGLYEVSTEEFNVYLESTRQRPRRIRRPNLPVDSVSLADVAGLLRFAGVSLPSLAQWHVAAAGTDGRPLPWGQGGAKARANVDSSGPEAVTARGDDVGPYGLHHVLGNVWELIEGEFAMGGSSETPYPLQLFYQRPDKTTATWEPDLMREPRPLAPAGDRLEPGDEMRRKWKEVLFVDPELARVKQPGIGLRVVIRIERR